MISLVPSTTPHLLYSHTRRIQAPDVSHLGSGTPPGGVQGSTGSRIQHSTSLPFRCCFMLTFSDLHRSSKRTQTMVRGSEHAALQDTGPGCGQEVHVTRDGKCGLAAACLLQRGDRFLKQRVLNTFKSYQAGSKGFKRSAEERRFLGPSDPL